ncbi:MAG: hypothetical protein HHAS10_00010 [Candidatus Altimarinota bacterium]
MKKIILLLLGLGLISGSVLALFPGLFPDTPAFPRIPIGDGTIGKVFTKLLGTNDLGNYAGDGTVPNSLALSGVSASGYLKDDSSCSSGQKYIGIDSSGKRICGTVNVLLTDYATIQSQDCPADYYRIDNTQGLTATGNVLKAGDIVKTPPGCTMTIVFADSSILRLDGDTTISLDLGTLPDGTTIASAMLSNGSVWGRILTETGSYNVGTEIIVVGVRGTSINLSSTGNVVVVTNTGSGWGILKTPSSSQTFVNLVDSRFSSGASVRCKNQSTHLLESLDDIKVGGLYIINPLGCTGVKPSPVGIEKYVNYGNNWIRKNVRKDIEYMYGLGTISGSFLSPSKRIVLRDEILAASPNILADGNLTSSGNLEAMSLCDAGNKWWNERYRCMPNNILATADFSLPALSDITNMASTICPDLMTLSVFPGRLPTDHLCRENSSGTLNPGAGFKILASGQYIGFSGSEISSKLGGYSALSGKTLTLEIKEPITLSATKHYIFEFGTEKLFIVKNGICFVGDVNPVGNYFCKTRLGVTTNLGTYSNQTNISFTLSTIPSQFIIGNNIGYNFPIKATLKKFVISN